MRRILIGFLAVAAITGGLLSWFASSHPDGLEWAMFHTAGKEALATPDDRAHHALGQIQEKVAILPDYDFRKSGGDEEGAQAKVWPAASTGTSVSGLVGGTITMLLAGLIGLGLRKYYKKV